MTDKHAFTTGCGRLVAGSMTTPSTHDMKGKLRDKPQYFFALALPKSDPATSQVISGIMAYAHARYAHAPQVQARMAAGIGARDFAWKIADGDDPQFAGRDGHAGCYIIRFTTTFPLRTVDRNNGQLDPAAVQNGYYVQVAGNVEINGATDDTAGIYMNPVMVRMLGAGPLIFSGPNASQVFGDAPVPAAPGGMVAPGAQAAPAVPGGNYAMPPQAAPAVPGGNYAMPPQAAPAVPGTGQAPAVPGGNYAMPPQAAPAVPGYQPHPGILIPGTGQ